MNKKNIFTLDINDDLELRADKLGCVLDVSSDSKDGSKFKIRG